MARGNPDNLRAAAQRKSHATVKRAETALRTMIKNDDLITFRGVARTSHCSIDFLYGNPELRRRIEHLRAQQQTKPSPPATDANADSNVIRALTLQLAETRRCYREEVDELRAALAAAHGENLELRRKLGPRNARRAPLRRSEHSCKCSCGIPVSNGGNTAKC